MFGVRLREPPEEEWPAESWLHAAALDPRTDALSGRLEGRVGTDYAMYSDGGQSNTVVTRSAQAMSFGPVGDYWGRGARLSGQVAARLPRRFGFERTSILPSWLAG